MDLIYQRTKDGAVDSGFLSHFDADFDISNDPENFTNTFQIKMELTSDLLWVEDEVSCIVYVPGTEFGGIIDGSTIDLQENEVTYTGHTWRGLQSLFVIEPPAGQSHLVVSGNIKTCLDQFPMHPMIEVQATSYTSPSYQVARYVETFKGVAGLLGNLGLTSFYSFNEVTGKAELTVGPARDLTDLIDMSQDYGDHIGLKITRDGSIPRQMVCLGAGELVEREVLHLFASPPDWTITETGDASAFPVYVYDYSSSTDLLADGRKKYKEIIANHTQIELDVYDLDLTLGDVIAAQDHITGEKATAEITKIVWKAQNMGSYQEESFQYETKVRN